MHADRERRLLELLGELREVPVEERAGYVDRHCADDRELGEHVLALLAGESPVGGLPEPPPRQELLVPLLLPEALGPYRLGALVATGGMGWVFEAVDATGDKVALKVVRPDKLEDEETRGRFRREVRLLRDLEHPHIARIVDEGSEPLGEGDVELPWFAMEFVESALPITDYARGIEADAARRLELFADACSAVGHGHDQGIVHRDLKPSNILVDREGRVRVIDFGVARGRGTGWQLTSLRTATGAWIGTPNYMSPEQARPAADATSRSDVYSLGVVLYELLHGRRPYELDGASPEEVARLICEEPPRPARTGNAGLDRVLERALQKHAEFRFADAHELGAALRDAARGRRVRVVRPGALFRFRQFLRHSPAVAALAGLLVLVLLTAGSAGWWLHVRATAAAEKNARLERQLADLDRSGAELDALLLHVLRGSGVAPDDLGEPRGDERLAGRQRAAPEGDAGELRRAAEQMLTGLGQVERSSLREEELARLARLELSSLVAAGRYGEALGLLGEPDIDRRLEDFGTAREELVRRCRLRGDALAGLRQWEEAARSYRRVLELQPLEPLGYDLLTDVLERSGDYEACEEVYADAVRLWPDDARLRYNRALQLARLGRNAEAAEQGFRALELRPDDAATYQNLGVVLYRDGRHAAALACFEAAARIAGDGPLLQVCRADALASLGEHDAALDAYQAAYAAAPEDPRVHSLRAIALARAGRCGEARHASDLALRHAPCSARHRFNQGVALNQCGAPREALDAFDACLALDPTLARAHWERGMTLVALERPVEALAAVDEALALRPGAAMWHWGRAQLGHRLGDGDVFVAAMRDALSAGRLPPGVEVEVRYNLAAVHGREGRYEECVEAVEGVFELRPDHRLARRVHCYALSMLGAGEAVEEALREGLRYLPDDPQLRRLAASHGVGE